MAAQSPSSRARATTPRKSAGASSTTKRTPRNQVVAPQKSGGPSALETGWLAVASFVGAGFRVFSAEPLAKEDRRDGVPFALVLFAIVGIVVEWFNYNQTWALNLDTYTVGGAMGRLAFALPVILIALAIWLFRNPSSVYRNGRVAIGLALLLVSVSGMTHLALGRPAPGDASFAELAAAGGVLGWLVAEPFVLLGAATVYLAWPVMMLFLLVSLLIMTKTPPNKIVSRSREAYAYLFGVDLDELAQKKREESTPGAEFGTLSDLGLDMSNPDSMPWWRRGKTDKKDAFDSPIVSTSIDDTGKVESQEDLLEQLRKAEAALAQATQPIAGAPEPAAKPEPPAPAPVTPPATSTAPSRLPDASVLVPGTPPKSRSAANDAVVA
ncbi:MAG: DNA translocase FtsK 4TM domain-containing protein, partial [Pontimonas sp.]